jgi:hypothetical protein
MAPCDRVIENYFSSCMALAGHHHELLLAVNNKRNEEALRTLMAEQLMLNSAIMWEGFVSDLLLAYIQMQPQAALDNIALRVRQSLKDKHGDVVARLAPLRVPPEMSAATVAAIVDSKGLNLTAPSAARLTALANNLLAANYARLFAFERVDSELIDLTIATRNYLAHRSRRSLGEWREKVSSLNEAENSCFSTTAQRVGTYLKQRDADNTERVIVFVERLAELSLRLR